MLNKYFNYYNQTSGSGQGGTLTSEQELYDSMLIESIQIKGLEVKYLRKTTDNIDRLFGEDTSKMFEEAVPIEMYLRSFTSFGDMTDAINILGHDIKDECDLTVSKTRFFEEFGHEPFEGDLIYLPLKNKKEGMLFEIRFVEDEDQFYPLANLMHYKLKCSLWEHSQEDFDTADFVIDSVEDDNYPEERENIVTQQGDNEFIQNEADEIIERDENNPFGDYS